MDTNSATTSFSNRTNEHAAGTLRQSVQNSCTKVGECVQKNPQSSMLISLGVGLGVGVVVGSLLGNSRSSSSRWFERQNAQRLGERLIAQMSSLVPDAVSDRFGT